MFEFKQTHNLFAVRKCGEDHESFINKIHK